MYMSVKGQYMTVKGQCQENLAKEYRLLGQTEIQIEGH